MDHGMAIGAKRSEVSNWVDRVGPSHIGNRHDVVHVNIPSPYITVTVLKVKPADHAGRAVVRDALITRRHGRAHRRSLVPPVQLPP